MYAIFSSFFVTEKKKNRAILIAFIGAFILATSRWYFNFARFSYEGVFLVALESLSMLFAAQYVRLKKGWLLLAAGFFAGLAYLSYLPGRFFILVPLTYLWSYKTSRAALSAFIATFLIVILPLTMYLLRYPDKRVSQQLYLANTELSLSQKGNFLMQNVVAVPQMLTVKGDGNGRHNYPFKPAINPILLMLLVTGIGVAYIRRTREDLLVFVWSGIALLPMLLTYPWENPHMHRTITFVIPLAYFCARAVGWLWAKNFSRYAVLSIVVLVLISSMYELRTYFTFQKDVFPHAFEITGDLDSALKKYKPH
ncbi:MAG: hypothetical protein UZ21_OP11001000020 [Microgenomates bacterium OLB22]|nr:MAG: hypothetical protein UZ21_OP11001000020 [Microgenomates bacterium OLB22]